MSSGVMSLAYPQVCDHHSRPCSPAMGMSTQSETIAAAKAMLGASRKKNAAPATTHPDAIRPSIGKANQRQRTIARGRRGGDREQPLVGVQGVPDA
jgi:hypothetical protein